MDVIKLADGTEIEVELDPNSAYEISDSNQVSSSLEKIQGLLSTVVKPIANTYRELNKEVRIAETKLILGVKVGAEGNFVLAKSNVNAHIQVEMTLKDAHD